MKALGMKSVLLGAVCVSWFARAQVVNIDIQTVAQTVYSGADAVLSTPGGTFWNNSANYPISGLQDEFGAATSNYLVLVQWLGSVSTSGSHPLFMDGLTVSSSSAVIYDIRNLNPYKKYDVVVFFLNSDGEAYLSDATNLYYKAQIYGNGDVLPGTEDGEYLRFRGLLPYEQTTNVYGVKLYAYANSFQDAIAGIQFKDTGTRANIAPRFPAARTPTNGQASVSLTNSLTASPFQDSDAGDTHSNSRWQISSNSSFSAIAWDSGDAAAGATNTVVGAGILNPGRTYYWRVRYKDSAGNWSPFSTSYSFTTIVAPTGYNAWVSAVTNGLTNYNDSATGDGYPNLLKYATGSSPTSSDKLATLSGILATNDNRLTLQFNRNTNAVDVTIFVEGSFVATNGSPWIGLITNKNGSWNGATNVIESGSATPKSVAVRDVVPSATNRFLRIRVTRP